ncbi:Uncharacterized protein APZ42_008481 [Daphnia magna]|uniref:Regulatory protein zeste n=1 Tax=Daphnia magna TaxID=35525 RepID=A0A164EM17_9CRUS|nr:Uncharacterized protein APZ42_008481 [Daphnia magna]
MASNNKVKALKKSVNKPISVCESSVSLKNRIEWTTQEENFLVDEFELRRHILQGAHDHPVTREKKTKAWNEIHETICLEFPDGGGPEYQFKKPLHKKIFEDVIGVNNPAIANGGIEGGVESETASSSCVVKARKSTPTPNVDDIAEDERSNHSVITSDGIVDIT